MIKEAHKLAKLKAKRNNTTEGDELAMILRPFMTVLYILGIVSGILISHFLPF